MTDTPTVPDQPVDDQPVADPDAFPVEPISGADAPHYDPAHPEQPVAPPPDVEDLPPVEDAAP